MRKAGKNKYKNYPASAKQRFVRLPASQIYLRLSRVLKIALFLAVFALQGVFLSAREVSVIVLDADIELPLEGALVHSWDGKEYECNAEGEALVSVPDNRQVSVQVTYPGYETGRFIIPREGDTFSLSLRLGDIMESRELLVEAVRQGAGETRSGRSVAISGEALERSSRIGLIEDVMTSIKLLPGVGYAGMFNALPSIRGGFPGDLMAALDGFYIESPYHWGGAFSIFDPHMIESAQLSHGIFSGRYGHTVSGLLELNSKKAPVDHAELELGISSSAVNLNAALPLGERGGLMLMGKVTYWDPFILLLQKLSDAIESDSLELINAVTTAPYIRSAAASFHYRVNADTEVNAAAFAGADGVGARYNNNYSDSDMEYKSRMAFDFSNLKTFLIAGLSYTPRPSMLLKASAGAGYNKSLTDADIDYDYLTVRAPPPGYTLTNDDLGMFYKGTQSAANIQGRVDFDVSPGNGFLFAAGIQELYSQNISAQEGQFFLEEIDIDPASSTFGDFVHYKFYGKLNEVKNRRYNSSAYVLAEYTSSEKRFGAELGLRLDHLYFQGRDFSLQTAPVLNPRFNLDFNVFKNRGIMESLDLTAGTGLFSSTNEAIAFIAPDNNIRDFELRPNRSWTSIIGVKTDLPGGFSFNLEGYFKYVYDRAYMFMNTGANQGASPVSFRFNGDGIVWGFDLQIQKFESRYWDGWISYTFTHARYHESERPVEGYGGTITLEDSGWYYPYFHRFHNINLVLNFKPSKNFSIYTRLGLASGQPKPEAGKITAHPVTILDENGDPSGTTIIKYKREEHYSDNSRTGWSIPLDVKLSYNTFNPRSKVLTEMYFAAENLFSLFYRAQANTSFNEYTGKEDTGSDSASYEMPVPMISLGVKWSF